MPPKSPNASLPESAPWWQQQKTDNKTATSSPVNESQPQPQQQQQQSMYQLFKGHATSISNELALITRFPLHLRPSAFLEIYTTEEHTQNRPIPLQVNWKQWEEYCYKSKPSTANPSIRADVFVTPVFANPNQMVWKLVGVVLSNDTKDSQTAKPLMTILHTCFNFPPLYLSVNKHQQSDGLVFCQAIRTLELQWLTEQKGSVGDSSYTVVVAEPINFVPFGSTWSWSMNLNVLRWLYAGFTVQCNKEADYLQHAKWKMEEYGKPRGIYLCRAIVPPKLKDIADECAEKRDLGTPTQQISTLLRLNYTEQAIQLWRDYEFYYSGKHHNQMSAMMVPDSSTAATTTTAAATVTTAVNAASAAAAASASSSSPTDQKNKTDSNGTGVWLRNYDFSKIASAPTLKWPGDGRTFSIHRKPPAGCISELEPLKAGTMYARYTPGALVYLPSHTNIAVVLAAVSWSNPTDVRDVITVDVPDTDDENNDTKTQPSGPAPRKLKGQQQKEVMVITQLINYLCLSDLRPEFIKGFFQTLERFLLSECIKFYQPIQSVRSKLFKLQLHCAHPKLLPLLKALGYVPLLSWIPFGSADATMGAPQLVEKSFPFE